MLRLGIEVWAVVVSAGLEFRVTCGIGVRGGSRLEALGSPIE